jgi:hypothetical protein
MDRGFAGQVEESCGKKRPETKKEPCVAEGMNTERPVSGENDGTPDL